MANEVIDRYQILEKIGAGGMGTVYLAWDRDIQREVALKWLPTFFSQDEHFTERFKREARVVARLEHPHIVPIYDVGESEGRPFIIMRLLKGGTLRDQIGKEGFDLAALVKGLEEIGDALAAAHARNIIHRDIKPGNILFDENGAAFLSDFGIAKVLDSGTQLTGSGFIGTPAYMSPEQFIGQAIDGRSDQYALGIVVYEALTGTLPFQGNTAQMMYKHINAMPPEIDLDEHPIPGSFNHVLQKALAKKPEDRYARIMDFTTALRIALRQDPIAAALPLAAGIGLVPTPQKPPTAPTSLDTPEVQKTNLLRQNYREGLEAMSRSQWAAALASFDKVLNLDPTYGNVVEFRKQAETNLHQTEAVSPAAEDQVTAGAPAAASAAALAEEEDQEEGDHDLAKAAALGLGAAAMIAGRDQADGDAGQKEAPVVEQADGRAGEDDLEATSLDLPSGAYAAAAAADDQDLDKTTLDLPPGVLAAGAAAAASAAAREPDLDKTSLDLPSGAFAAGAGAAAAEADLDKTSLDLPPGVYAGMGAGAAAAASAAGERPSTAPPPAATPAVQTPPPPAAARPQEEQRKIPVWAIIAGIILLLAICGGGAYAAVNMLGGGDGETTAVPPGGGIAAVAGGQETPAAGTETEVTAESPTTVPPTAEIEPTTESAPPTAEPTEEPVVVVVEDTAAPPPTEAPTDTPQPEDPIVRVNVASANLRRGPGVVYGVLQAVLENDLATVVARDRTGGWFLVQLENGTLGWLSSIVVESVGAVGIESVQVAATIPVAPTLTPVPPTPTPIPLPTIPPTAVGSGDGGGGGGGGDDGGGGGEPPPPPPVYTAEPP